MSLQPLEPEVLEFTAREARRGRVVMGLRDSWHAADALAVGFAEANRRGAELVVSVIREAVPDDAAGGGIEPAFHVPDEQDIDEVGHLPRAVTEVARGFPAVAVTTSVRTGHFAETLVELARSADLLVLGMGDRPAGMGRQDLLIASRSTCPVIVVRENSAQGGV